MGRHQSGFTLVELMMVIVIIGLSLAVVNLAIRSDANSEAQSAMETLVGQATYMVDQATLNYELIGLFIQPRPSVDTSYPQYCYQWQRFRNNEWQALYEDIPEICFHPSLEATWLIEGKPYVYDEELEQQAPVLAFYPSGEATLLELSISAASSATTINSDDDIQRLEVSPLGEIRWLNRLTEAERERMKRR